MSMSWNAQRVARLSDDERRRFWKTEKVWHRRVPHPWYERIEDGEILEPYSDAE